MSRFILKILLFLLPLALLFVFPIAVFLIGREEYSTRTATLMQTADQDIVLGKAYTDTDNTGIFYKTQLVREKKPKIITMGSSRTMEFRKEFFAKPDTFVGASFSAANTGQFEGFIRDLPPSVKIIVLGLDHRIFRPDYVSVIPNGAMTPGRMVSDFLTYDWRWIYFDYARGRFTFNGLLKRNRNSGNIGLEALMDGNGYRGDGSYSYAKQLSDPNRTEVLASKIKDTLATLKKTETRMSMVRAFHAPRLNRSTRLSRQRRSAT